MTTQTEEWTARANVCRFTHADVVTLGEPLPKQASHLVLFALNASGPYPATVLAFCCALQQQAIDKDTLLALIPEVEDIRHAVALIRHADVGPAEMLLELIAAGRLSNEREALALYLTIRDMNGEVPPLFVTTLRRLARLRLSIGAIQFVAAAAHELGDQELLKLTVTLPPSALRALREETSELLDIGSLLPKVEAPRTVSGYTVKRTEPKVGRNEACPCGSKKKYKKCCANKDQVAKSSSHSSAGLTEKHLAKGGAHLIGDDQFRLMRPHELAKLEPQELPLGRLIAGWYKLAQFCRWDDAERWVEELTSRDLPGESAAAHWWGDLGDQALRKGEVELAERCRSKLDDELGQDLDLGLLLARHDSSALETLENTVREDLKNETYLKNYSVAYALLEQYPALGIFFARGCLVADRYLDSETLMQAIEEARDELGLSVEDPYWSVWDFMIDQGQSSEMSRLTQLQRDELRDVQEQISDSRRDVERVNSELKQQQQKLASMESPSVPELSSLQRGEPRARTSQGSEVDSEKQKLRARVSQLRTQIREGSQERQALRGKMEKLRKQSTTVAKSSQVSPDSDDLEANYEWEQNIPLRIPLIDEKKAKELHDLPRDIAGIAVRRMGELASGDRGAWQQVKSLRRSRDLLSVRIGIHYRLLFSISHDLLTLTAVIHRKNLERFIDRKSSQ